MKMQIIVDSASDLRNDYIEDEDLLFGVVPMSVKVNNEEFIDDDNADAKAMLKAMHAYSGKSTSSCPPMGSFYEEFLKADYTICICITSKLSGTYNSACQAAKMANDEGHHVFVVDSKLVCGAERLLVDKAHELIKSGMDFDSICDEIIKYRDNLNLLFVLQKFDNFVKSGRISKLVGVIASLLFIKPLCSAEDGEIKILEKIRTAKGAFKRLVQVIGEKISDFSSRVCIISHCQDEELAKEVAKNIGEAYNFKKIEINEMKSLCSFYALEKGIIVCF